MENDDVDITSEQGESSKPAVFSALCCPFLINRLILHIFLFWRQMYETAHIKVIMFIVK